MNKGCGCVGFTLAVALGLALGVVGLGVAGYLWVDSRVLADEPAQLVPLKWTKLDEAALAAKLAPAALSIRNNRESEHSLKLKPDEASRLIDQYIIARDQDVQARLAFGDTATIVNFSALAREGKYINGELRAQIDAEDGDFSIKVYSLSTGNFKWPRPALPHVAKWLEGVLETQTLFKDDPWRLVDYSSRKDQLKIKVRIVPRDNPQDSVE